MQCRIISTFAFDDADGAAVAIVSPATRVKMVGLFEDGERKFPW